MKKNNAKGEKKEKRFSVVMVSVVMAAITMFSLNSLKTNDGETGLDIPGGTANEYANIESGNVYGDNGITFETDDNAADVKSENTSKTESTSSKKNTSSEQTDNTDTDSTETDKTPEYSLLPVMSDYVAPENVDPLIMLVNRYNPLPDDYTVETVLLSNGKQVSELIYDDLQQMFDDARTQGFAPYVSEGLRTGEEQEKMMQEYIDAYIAEGYTEKEAKRLALDYVAKPGTSEHEAGLAVDINGDKEELYGWLAENAYKYGFILRYPAGKEYMTGISFEPWHYRYVGRDYALEIYNSGECLEEYVENVYSRR